MAQSKGEGRSSKGGRPGGRSFDIRSFRHQVSQLKKLGAVSKRQDARKQRPTRYMRAKVGRLQTLLRGEAVLVRKELLRPDIVADYVRTQQKEGKRHVLIRKEAAEKINIRLGMPEFSKVIADTGKRRVMRRRIPLPIDLHNIEQFTNDLRRNPQKWASARGGYPPWLFGFTIGGNRSSSTYEDPELMADEIDAYTDADSEEFWDAFELYAVDEEFPWAEPRRRGRSGKRRNRDQSKTGHQLISDRNRKRRERASLTEAQREAARKMDREAKAARRQDVNYRRREKARDMIARRIMRTGSARKPRGKHK